MHVWNLLRYNYWVTKQFGNLTFMPCKILIYNVFTLNFGVVDVVLNRYIYIFYVSIIITREATWQMKMLFYQAWKFVRVVFKKWKLKKI